MAGATDGIRIAFNSQAFNPSPTWVRVDGGVGLSSFASQSATSYTIDRGRQFQLDATQTGTGSLVMYDTTGMFDATNPDGPFFGEIGPMRQINFQMQNPVNGLFYSLFTGFTESWYYTFPDPQNNRIMEVTVAAVDGFDALSRAELPPDNTGTTTFAPIVGIGAVAARIEAVLAYFSATPYSGNGYQTDTNAIFSGNVNLLGAVYNAQTSLLTPIMDAAAAESGGIANNVFMDKLGNLNFRGRATRFRPENFQNFGPPTLAKPITFWKVGDADAASTISACAPIHDIEWGMDETKLINAATVYPGGIYNAATINGQLVTSTSYPPPSGTNSILKYGPRSLSVPDLYTFGSPTGTADTFLNPADLTGLEETLLFAQSYVDNFATPVPYISKLTFQTVAPGGSAGNAWWNFVTGVEIGDVITVYLTDPGGGGFSRAEDGFATDQFFVEGIHYDVQLGGGNYPQITLNLDVSSRQWSNWFNGYSFYPTPPS